jgi:hypothetical protein
MVRLGNGDIEMGTNRYLKQALIGLVASCPLCYVLLVSIDFWPKWEDLQVMTTCVYFILSGPFIASCSAFLSDLFSEQDEWANHLMRHFYVFLVGASLGLFLLMWTAILSLNGLGFLYTGPFQHFLNGAGSEPLRLQARDLVPKAELLAACKMIVENCVQYASFFAALAITNFWTYKLVNHARTPAFLLFCLRSLIPSVIVTRILFLLNPSDFMTFWPICALAFLFVCFVCLSSNGKNGSRLSNFGHSRPTKQ